VVVGSGEVEAPHHLGGGERPRLDHSRVVRLVVSLPVETGVGVVDAGVDDGDADILASVTVTLERFPSDPGDAGLVGGVVPGNRGDALYALGGPDGGDVSQADQGPDAVGSDSQPGPFLDDHAAQFRGDAVLLRHDLLALGALGGETDTASGNGLRHRWLIELDEDLDGLVEVARGEAVRGHARDPPRGIAAGQTLVRLRHPRSGDGEHRGQYGDDRYECGPL